MNTPCKFDKGKLAFVGTPLEQARCLLRFVKRGGNVDDVAATLPAILETLLTDPAAVAITSSQLRQYLAKHNIPESSVGGRVDKPVSRADSNDANAPLARYFLIHDTSAKLDSSQSFDPNFINTYKWSGNNLSSLERGKTHVYITRMGDTLTDADYQTAWRATQFELRDTIFRGLCLHHELVQPRKGPGKSDIESPNPGFTQVQYERLSLQYIIASVRSGSWMIPAFHCVLDLGIGDHDDPQRFDIGMWGATLEAMLDAVREVDTDGVALSALTSSPAIHLDFAAATVALAATAGTDFTTPKADSQTEDGRGGSSTSGLSGKIAETADGSTIIKATETVSAHREGHNLGPARVIAQVRISRDGTTVVEQPEYCWGRRVLSNAELVENYPGFGADPAVFEGKATFFGKSDPEDEGTGTPSFGTVQTNSSVFGISLKRARLLNSGLAANGLNGVLQATEMGLRAIVEVYYAKTGRLVRLPLVDVGPGNTGAAKTAIADLTVAATAFLQKLTEDDIADLDNIRVQARITVPPAGSGGAII